MRRGSTLHIRIMNRPHVTVPCAIPQGPVLRRSVCFNVLLSPFWNFYELMNNGPALWVCTGPYTLYSLPWLAPVDLLVHKSENCLQSWNGCFSIHISAISVPSFNQKSNSMSQDDGPLATSSFPLSLQEPLCVCCTSLGFCNSDNKNWLKTWTCTRLLTSKKIRLHLRNCTSAQTSDLISFWLPTCNPLIFSSSHVLDCDESSELFVLWGPNGTMGMWQNWKKGIPAILLLARL